MRRHAVPVGFLVREAKGNLTPEILGEWIAGEIGPALVAEAISDELRPADTPAPACSLTVAICTRHRADSLARCLESLRACRGPFAILVVDNAPPDDSTATLIRQWPEIRYVREPRAGLDFARNRAWQEAKGDWIAYLDDDVVVDAGWHQGLREALAENPDASAVTGLVLPLELATSAQILFTKRGGFRRGFTRQRYRDTLPGNALHPAGAGIFGTGANMAFRRDILQQLGGFDEALDTGRPLPGGGDLDIFFRIIKGGFLLAYEPRFLVFHEDRKDLPALRQQYYTWGLGLMAYAGKHLRPESLQRDLFLKLVRWWFRHQLHQLKECLRGRHPLPADMLLAELWGGVVGLCGEYGRSQRRIARIKRALPDP